MVDTNMWVWTGGGLMIQLRLYGRIQWQTAIAVTRRKGWEDLMVMNNKMEVEWGKGKIIQNISNTLHLNTGAGRIYSN